MTPTSDDPAEFWRYVNGIKFSAVVSAIESFSTRDPAPVAISRLFSAIGKEVAVIVDSQRNFHFFSNPDLRQLHYLECGKDQEYRERAIEFRHQFDRRDLLKWWFIDLGCPRTDLGPEIPGALGRELGAPRYVALAPFCKNDTPFGYFAFCWYQEAVPAAFGDSRLKEAAAGVLDYLHTLVTRLVCNHYPMHRDTYAPSFQRTGTQAVCVLFADIRNFTAAFETSRLASVAGQKYPELLIGFIKAYLEAASIIIAEPGIGRIDKFIGDGIMATFGEYIVSKAENDVVASLLGLYAAAVLHDAFAKLLARLRNHPAFRFFMRQYNDVLNLRLGIGINFGEVVFDYFGSPSHPVAHASNLIGGYSEYTAVGDNVNAAQRLEGLASKPVNQVSVLERGLGRDKTSPNLIAPIVMSRTAFLRATDALRPIGSGELTWEEQYRSAFAVKGKGSAVEAYEVFEKEINGASLVMRLSDLVGPRLLDTVRARWKNNKFEFDDDTSDKLARRYFP